jgi:hypothetical protein
MSIESDCLARDENRCFRCGKLVPNAAGRNCHHRLPAGRGGPDTLDNRITLCGFGNNLRGPDGEAWCHGVVHQGARVARALGWLISQYDVRTPEEIPVRHWNLGMVYLTPDGGIVTEAERNAREDTGHG